MDRSERRGERACRAFQEAHDKKISPLLLSSAGLSVRMCACVCVCVHGRVCKSYTNTRNFNVNTIHSLLKLAFGLSPQVRSAIQRHCNCTVIYFFCRDFTHARSSSSLKSFHLLENSCFSCQFDSTSQCSCSTLFKKVVGGGGGGGAVGSPAADDKIVKLCM